MNRKDEHLHYALMQKEKVNDFDKIRFVGNSLHTISVNEIDLSSSICGIKIPYPFYINAMTGGSMKAKDINEKLAIIASYFNIPIASGSLSVALKDKSTLDSFQIIREKNPNGIVMANLGADKTLDDVLVAMKILNANIMQIHLNKVQELIMPEGERDFSKWQDNIKEIINNVSFPVIVKEVGFGMSKETIQTLKGLGVKTIDISGNGGTNFAIIENNRRNHKMEYLNNWGLSTVESLLEASVVKDLEILASGGIRNALDLIKAIALGANAVGLSSYFLNLVDKYDIEDVIKKVEEFIEEIKVIMTIIGAKTISEVKYTKIIFSSDIINYMNQRNIYFKINKFLKGVLF